MRKSLAVFFVVAFAFAAFGDGAERKKPAEVSPQPYYGAIAKRLAGMWPRYHVRGTALNDVVSACAWTNLVTSFDHDRTVFRQADIDGFATRKFLIDDAMKRGDVSFGYEVYRLFTERLAERINFATNYLASINAQLAQDKEGDVSPLSKLFLLDEDYCTDRSEATWPVTSQDQDELWRLRIKNEVLAQICVKELDAEKKVAKGKPGANISDICTEAVSNLVKRYSRYYDFMADPDEEAVLQRYLSAVATSFDPHTDYMSPVLKEDFDHEMSLSLCGVGAVLQMDEGMLKIVEVMPGGPMDKDGRIKKGDKIVGVGQGDGEVEDIQYRPMNKTIRKIRGKPGTKVVLEIVPKHEPGSRKRYSLIRDEIKLEDQAATGRVERVELKGVKHNFGYIKLPAFYGTMDRPADAEGYRSCTLDVAELIAEFNESEIGGLVLDLRGNGGGALREAVLLTSLFVKAGPVVQVREQNFNIYQLPIPNGNVVTFRKPLVVMIDRSSASASEIVAGALQDTGRAVVVGDRRTHGKGTVQTVMPVSRDTRFGSTKITTARFYRINGSSTQVKGVEADIELPSLLDDLDVGEEKLPNALPFSRIQPASYSFAWNLASYVDELKSRSAVRLADNDEWKKHLDAVASTKELMDRKSVPLNHDKRLELMRKDRERLKNNDKSLTDDGEEDDDEEADAKPIRRRGSVQLPETKDDIVLAETFNILADLVELTGGKEMPEAKDIGGVNWLRFFGGEE